MEKRINKRVKTHQLARICGKMGVINNISNSGLHVSTSILPKTRKVDICFETPAEEIVILGTVKWFQRKNSLHHLNQLGIVVKNAPPEFYEMVDQLGKN